MNTYSAYCSKARQGNLLQVETETAYQAQQKAVKLFQELSPRKRIEGWTVSVDLIGKDGVEIVQVTDV